MGLRDALQLAIEALAANKLRASLTMLGIIIGVGAVIALMAVGQGSQKAVTDRIEGLGTNLLFIRPGATNNAGVRTAPGSALTLSQEDAEAIAAEIPGVVAAVPQSQSGGQLIAGGNNTFASIIGVTPQYTEVTGLELASGFFFTDEDVTRTARVAVLGANVAQTLFPDGSDPVGQNVRVQLGPNSVTLRVTGVIKAKGGNQASSYDNQVFVPLTTVQRQLSFFRSARNTAVVTQITVKVRDKGNLEAAKQSITQLLSQRHGVAEPDFTVESQEDLAESAREVSRAMTVLLGSIAGISLVVGGIGIMNIMLVSVTERTREIGIRKAVGARQADIMMQFLTEALTVTVVGGLLGIAAGLGAARFMDGKNIAGLGENVQTVISWSSVGIAFLVSGAIGLFFGIYPAQRAARLRPIDALRYE
ncbi:MAG TPA: ABC transporter permease [Dehalococcoidia bacterium]|nr:ABC transporter permease [Dehalococcoidia bacterium]